MAQSRANPRPGDNPLIANYEGNPSLRFTPQLFEAIVEHCRSLPFIEACGIVSGVEVPIATSVYPLRNAHASPTSYEADRRDLVAAVKLMRSRHEQMLAIYHSHLTTAAIPSRADIERNYYGKLPRIIVSIMPSPAEVRVWRLDASTYHELSFVVED
jgi:proteasome lid subunit RPN8/RPN11